MDAKEFLCEYKKIFEVANSEAVECYQNDKLFTAYITEKIIKIICDAGYTPEKEYYRIDIIGYKNNDIPIENMRGFNKYLWDLGIAVEHENDSKAWMDEVVKLAHIYFPLRVVIAYAPVGKDVNPILDYIVNGLKKLKCYNNMKNGEFLIILGNCTTKKKSDYFGYKGYLFNKSSEKFEKIG